MYSIHEQEEREFTITTDAEWDRAEAYEKGELRPDLAWICTNRDAWHPNPFYQGPPVPHPESYDPLYDVDGELVPQDDDLAQMEEDERDAWDFDDIPF